MCHSYNLYIDVLNICVEIQSFVTYHMNIFSIFFILLIVVINLLMDYAISIIVFFCSEMFSTYFFFR